MVYRKQRAFDNKSNHACIEQKASVDVFSTNIEGCIHIPIVRLNDEFL